MQTFLKLNEVSIYLHKAKENLEIAEYFLALSEGGSSVSAHFSYYSIFLLIKYLLNHYMGDSYAHQESESGGKDSHKILSNKALNELAKKDSVNANNYFSYYNHLNLMRKKADYSVVIISKATLQNTYDYAKTFFDNSVSLYKFAI